MGKYLLLACGILLVFWIVRASLRRRKREMQAQDNPATEDMVRCAACGVHLPRGESLTVRGQFYCCVAHQRGHDPDH
jgi:uncharacterized protein